MFNVSTRVQESEFTLIQITAFKIGSGALRFVYSNTTDFVSFDAMPNN